MLLGLVTGILVLAPGSRAGTVPAGFQETTVFTGLTNPTVIQFAPAPDGRIFIAEKSGIIKFFDNLSDSTPTTFVDLRTKVHNYWDRGLLGFALHPSFPTVNSVYVLYAHDAAIGGTAPRWGTAGQTSDGCPTPPGATADGCVISGRLSRIADTGTYPIASSSEQVFVEDWCQQYPSHSTGSLAFGADGALYATGGDGASFNFVDYGQDGSPLNPCGDPPTGSGTALTPPTAEGGALRSQDLRTPPPADGVSVDGAILRVDPATGAGLPNNPLAGSSDPNARRIVAHGLRNPFRMTIRPGTSEPWLGDVGWNDWEEVNRLADPLGAVENFGWPCYEGTGRQSGYDNTNLNICENLYGAGAGAVTTPYYTYHHLAKVVNGETCPTGSSSAAGLAFYTTGPFPDTYDGALFFSDYSRDCIWVMFKGANGLPDPANRMTFDAGASNPVDVRIGPDGNLYYADFDGGTIRRVHYVGVNQPPTAVATADPTNGSAPLEVDFDGTGSSDPEGLPLTYAWDLDGDGQFDDSNVSQPQFTYTQPGSYTARLRVTDAGGSPATSGPISITASNTPPEATILTPVPPTSWEVGDTISFSGSASDEQQGTLPASALSWDLVLQHCPSNCHEHPIQSWSGVSSGSFVAPDHEYPSYLQLELTAADAHGGVDATTIDLQPATVGLTFQTTPTGLELTVGSTTETATLTRTVIKGSTNSISAPTPQTLGATDYVFGSWSDGGAVAHNIVANAAATYTATYLLAAGTDSTVADFDGDGETDLANYRPSEGVWYVKDQLPFVQWGGQAGDVPVPGDYDGDGDTDVATYRPGEGVWYVRDQPPFVQWGGQAGDLPVPGDYDGDGDTDVATYRPGEGVWYVKDQPPFRQWGGQAGDIPVPGNYDGDADTDIATYRPSEGVWYIEGLPPYVQWGGQVGDIPVPGDYDGDGDTDIATYRPSQGMWYVRGQPPYVQWGGQPGDIPVPGDYDGDGDTDIATYRPSEGVWYVKGQPPYVQWGVAGDIPLVLAPAIRLRFFP